MTEHKCSCRTNNDDSIKSLVKEKYGAVAENAKNRVSTSCCGEGTCKDAITRDLYTEAETDGIPVEALLASMGCANPLALAEIAPGEVVLDLGCGGGIDVLISARRVGHAGKAYGLDMTDKMLNLARQNQRESGIENVEFLKGEIENIPLPDNSVDVIISNCVINLSTHKDRVMREAFRVLKPGGRFAVADIVTTRALNSAVQAHLAMWAGCVAGALQIDEYKRKLSDAGFINPDVEVVRTYSANDAQTMIPNDMLLELGDAGTAELMASFVSALVRATKPKRCCCCGK